ncbi:glutathione S-transferase family protein [Amphritea pacifica]|uniref:glutathione S-transferase family protein n=1 Tax=Amphritea pacifica TaxID=2811233 RepID=UPI0019652436|nr:glutathione S-transferase C-terminal domain-containing protein [Amphritea pacifica]MBN1009138.1 glutathione S-transferase C-terminal domain-containing protein [Amphritea pacifica]
MLVNGVWQSKWGPVQKKDEQGRFIRQSSAFRHTISPDRIAAVTSGDIEALGVKLYVAYICPWATRTLIARSLLGLEKYIPVSIVDPQLSDSGWRFHGYPGSTPAKQESITYIHQLYTEADPDYTGRATVPVLWDTEGHRIINNESADIIRIFNHDLRPVHNSEVDLAPELLLQEIDSFNERIYDSLNNGVYRAGFASTQAAYNEAYSDVFTTLEWLEKHFDNHRYAVGDQLTESDIRLFVTLARFDVAYYGLFKTNKAQIGDYANLSAYMGRLLTLPAFSKNTNIDHIKTGYYSIKALNPMGIVPEGPELDWFGYLK